MPSSRGFVHLLGGFRLDVAEREVVLPSHAQRVLAFLALSRWSGQPRHRTALAERLWCDDPQARAQASLRTAIWRIRKADRLLVAADRGCVRLGTHVEVDVERSLDRANRLLAGVDDLPPSDITIADFAGDLLPGWDEDWLTLERERIRQVRIHALVALSRRMCRLGEFVPAINAAYTAIAAEPLLEPAHAALVDVHLAEGDVVAARRQLASYSRLLWREMRLTPSDGFTAKLGRPTTRIGLPAEPASPLP